MKTTETPDLTDPSQPSLCSPATRCRTGKIARLPLEIREQLNQRMLEGEQGKSLVDWLNGLPTVRSILATQFRGHAMREQNLSEWRKGGYQTWLQEQEERHIAAAFVEKVQGLKNSAPDGLTESLAFYLAVRAATQIRRLESVPESEEKDKAFRQLSASVMALQHGELARERVRVQQERYGLQKKTQKERQEEFWKWAEKNINRDEFCRRRCYTAAEREAAINKILGITPQERGETVPAPAPAPAPVEVAPQASLQPSPDPSEPMQDHPGQSELIRPNPTCSDQGGVQDLL